MNPEQIRKLSDSLKVMCASHEGVRAALDAFCDGFYDEAVEAVTSPKATSEERAYWSGATANALEMKRHFADLISGDCKNWPMMKGAEEE